MDKDVYGIKLIMDVSDFEKGTKKVQKAIKDIEDKTKVVIRNPYSADFDFKDKFKDLDINELERKLKDAEKELQSFFDKAYKPEYTDFTEKVTEVVPTGSQEQLDAYAEKLEEVMSLRDELGSRTPIAIVSPEEKKQIEFEALSIEELNSKLLALQLKLRELQKVDIIDEEQQQKVQKLIEQIEKYKARIIELGGKPTHIKEMSEGTEEIADNLDQIGGKGKNIGNIISNSMTKGVKSLKRFALSLFGIQSVWRVISRATSAYMSQNTELANKLKSIWSGLGTLVGPIVDFLADLFLKLLGYINVVTKALFGFDFVAKANANTMKQYQKQISKTAKALSGLDEITNLQQHNEDDKGPALLEIPELNKGVVKFLEDVSKALKDNWDWLQYVLLGFGAVFGVSAIAGWVSNIGTLLGVAGTGAGAKGLLGLGSVLSWIATFAVIEIVIRTIYEKYHKKDMEDLVETTSDLAETAVENADGFQDVSNSLKKTTKEAKKGSTEINNYNNYLRDTIWSSADMIKINEENVGALGLVEKTYLLLSGGLSDYNEQQENFKIIIEESNDKIKSAVQQWQDLYNQGKLNKEQTKQYAETMALLGYNIDGSKMSVGKYMGVLKTYGYSEAEIFKIITNENSAYSILADKLKDINSKTQVATDTTDKYANKVNVLYDRLNDITKKKYGIDLQTKFGINADDLKRMLNNLKNSGLAKIFNFDKVIDNFMRSIPGFAIGTDLVKSDGLAYLHAGEKVVPADAVGGGYTGNDNETNGLLRELIEVVSNKDFTATITENDVGSASVNYIRKQNRMMGGSVI